MGNPRLRKAGTPFQYTAQQEEELVKCMLDREYFLRTYVKIKDVDSPKRILFDPRSYQKQMLKATLEERFVIVKLPRQAGKTVLMSAVLLHHVLFNQNYAILVAAHKGDKARDVLAMIKLMFEDLPSFLQQGVDEWNKGSIILENGSRIRTSATSPSAARGDTYNLVYLDEFAFVATHIADEFIKSIEPTTASGETTKIFITSTPKGLNMFYNMWSKSIIRDDPERWNGYVPIEIKWNDVPGRDEAFKARIIKTYGEDYFNQEYGAEFLGSSKTLIKASKLMALVDDRPIKLTEHTRVYTMPEKGRIYAMTVDVAEGLGGDCSAVVVFDITAPPYNVVCVYQSRDVDPYTLPGVILGMGKAYNNAMVLIEANFGQLVADMLFRDLEYEAVVFTARSSKANQAISGGFAPNARAGLKMDKLPKMLGCTALKTLVENDQLFVRDAQTIYELRRFAVKGKTYQAEEGHDDLAMCLVMFGWLVDQGYVRDLTSASVRESIAKINQRMIDDDVVPFGGIDTGTPVGEEAVVAVKAGDDSWLWGNKPDPTPQSGLEAEFERLERFWQ